LGIRPEHVEITDSDAMIEGTILSSLPSGMETIVQLSLGTNYLHSVIFGDLDFDVQKKVGISFSKGNFNIFDKTTTQNLGQGKLAKA
jgi:multiple sugar transport system ATP-binding protein